MSLSARHVSGHEYESVRQHSHVHRRTAVRRGVGAEGACHALSRVGRYNAQGAAGVLKDGLTSRKEILKGLAETTGSRLVGMWGVDAGDIHS